jgi:hypothetical protein
MISGCKTVSERKKSYNDIPDVIKQIYEKLA